MKGESKGVIFCSLHSINIVSSLRIDAFSFSLSLSVSLKASHSRTHYSSTVAMPIVSWPLHWVWRDMSVANDRDIVLFLEDGHQFDERSFPRVKWLLITMTTRWRTSTIFHFHCQGIDQASAKDAKSKTGNLFWSSASLDALNLFSKRRMHRHRTVFFNKSSRRDRK